MAKALMWRVMLYGAETWTMRKEDVRRIETFEMWIWRRMERISWTEHKTYEEVLIIERGGRKEIFHGHH